MRQFFAFVRKEFLHILRDRRTMLILLGMPVAQILLFGFAISTEVQNTRVAVLDPTPDHLTRRVADRLDASRYFDLAAVLHSPAEADRAFRRGEVGLVVSFADRYASRLGRAEGAGVQLIADATEPNQAQMLMNYAGAILQSALAEQTSASGSTAAAGAAINVRQRALFNPQAKSAYNFVPGVMGMILLLICAMMTSISIVREKETGTMEVLLASPMQPLGIILAKAVPYFVLSAVIFVVILVLGVTVLGVPVAGSLWLLVGLSLLYVLMALSVGLLISTLVGSQMAAMLISGMGFIMPTVILSGLMFPIESMPRVLQGLSCIVPARWYIAAVRKVMIEGVGFAYVAREFFILLGMTLACLAVSLKKFNVRLS